MKRSSEPSLDTLPEEDGVAPMDHDRWNRIQAVFDAACDLPADQRTAFLARECAGDPDLRDQVMSLLTADLEAEEVLSGAIREVVRSMIRSRSTGRRRT